MLYRNLIKSFAGFVIGIPSDFVGFLDETVIVHVISEGFYPNHGESNKKTTENEMETVYFCNISLNRSPPNPYIVPYRPPPT